MAESEQIWWTYVRLENIAEIYSERIDSKRSSKIRNDITSEKSCGNFSVYLIILNNIFQEESVCPSDALCLTSLFYHAHTYLDSVLLLYCYIQGEAKPRKLVQF